MARVCGISTYFLKKIARAAEFAARGSPKKLFSGERIFYEPYFAAENVLYERIRTEVLSHVPDGQIRVSLIASASDSESGFMYEFP